MPAPSRQDLRDPLGARPREMRRVARPPCVFSLGAALAPRASWVGPGRLQNPRHPGRSPPPPPSAPRAVPPPPPLRIRQAARPPAGGRGDAPSGAPRPRHRAARWAGRGRERGRSLAGAARGPGVRDESPPPPPPPPPLRGGEEGREEGRAGREKRKRSFETFPLLLGAGGAGTAWRDAAPRGGRTWGPRTAPPPPRTPAPCLPPARRPSGGPPPDQPCGAADADSSRAPRPRAHPLPATLGRQPLS